MWQDINETRHTFSYFLNHELKCFNLWELTYIDLKESTSATDDTLLFVNITITYMLFDN